jgi:hypothetical protein
MAPLLPGGKFEACTAWQSARMADMQCTSRVRWRLIWGGTRPVLGTLPTGQVRAGVRPHTAARWSPLAQGSAAGPDRAQAASEPSLTSPHTVRRTPGGSGRLIGAGTQCSPLAGTATGAGRVSSLPRARRRSSSCTDSALGCAPAWPALRHPTLARGVWCRLPWRGRGRACIPAAPMCAGQSRQRRVPALLAG